MIHGSPPPGTVRIGLAVPTYGPVTGVIVVNFTIVPGSAPAGADAPSTGTTLTRATPSAASSHLILLIFCLLSREPRQRSAGPGGPRISPFPRPGAGPGSAWSAPSWTGANEHTTPISWPICGSAASTGVRQFIGEDYEAAPVPAQAQAVLADFDTARCITSHSTAGHTAVNPPLYRSTCSARL